MNNLRAKSVSVVTTRNQWSTGSVLPPVNRLLATYVMSRVKRTANCRSGVIGHIAMAIAPRTKLVRQSIGYWIRDLGENMLEISPF